MTARRKWDQRGDFILFDETHLGMLNIEWNNLREREEIRNA